MIFVPEDNEQADVVARELIVPAIAWTDRHRQVFVGPICAVELEELERLDLLDDAVLEHREVIRREIGERLAVAIEDRDIDAHELRARAERGLLGRLLLRQQTSRHHRRHDEDARIHG